MFYSKVIEISEKRVKVTKILSVGIKNDDAENAITEMLMSTSIRECSFHALIQRRI